MKIPSTLPAFCLLLGTTVMAHADTPPHQLWSFETPDDLQVISKLSSTVQIINKGATEGKSALEVEFQPAEWPNAKFNAPKPWDWSQYSGFSIDITNPGTSAVAFGIRIDDDPASQGIDHNRTGNGIIGPGQTKTFVMNFTTMDPMSVGMRGLPQVRGANDIVLGANGKGAFDTSHIVNWQIFMHNPVAPTQLQIDNIRLVSSGAVSLDKIVDQLGQYAKADWPGKLHNETELAQRTAEEDTDLAAHPSLPDRDHFGGWSKGPQLPQGKFFSTVKQNGKWWLVDPDGHLFFSNGIDSMTLVDPETIVTGRENMFSWLPADTDPLAKNYSYRKGVHSGPVKEGKTFSFYGANLQRKYGDDYRNIWIDRSVRRLPSWGFNTVGNWADGRFFQNTRVPYVVSGGVSGDHAQLSSGSDYWGKMHDPFDPKFAIDAANRMKGLPQQAKDDPMCIGYFIENEMSWGGGNAPRQHYGLAYGALSLAATDSPAKRAFLDSLKAKYGDVTKLNTAWGTTFANWSALEAPYSAPDNPSEAMQADLSAFLTMHARKYFEVVSTELKKWDPNHLYLGCRFASKTPEAVNAAADYVDVLSFNIYKPSIDKEWDFLKAINKPAIIGEFHFGALDRGMFHTGLVATANQQERAQYYRNYVRSVLDHPSFVGCHWFQYIDEPLTGRSFDGENYNIGMLTVTDTPYPEMIQAAREVHSEVYTRRYGQ